MRYILSASSIFLAPCSLLNCDYQGLYASVASIQLLDRSKEIDTIDASSTHRTSECSVDDMAMAAVDGMAMTAPMQVPGWTAFEPILVTLDDPKKFATLMDKEQFLYDLAQSKQEALLHAWSMRQSTGSDSLRPPVVKGLVGTNEEQNQEQEAFALIKNEQIDNDKERDGNNDSCSDDDSDVNSAQGDLEGDEEADETNGKTSVLTLSLPLIDDFSSIIHPWIISLSLSCLYPPLPYPYFKLSLV